MTYEKPESNLTTCDLCGEEIIQTARGWHHRKRYHLHKARPRKFEATASTNTNMPESQEDTGTMLGVMEAADDSPSIIGTAMAVNQVAELASSFTPDPEPERQDRQEAEDQDRAVFGPSASVEPEPQRDYSPPISPEPAVDLPSIELEAPEPSCTGMDSSDSYSSGTDCSCDCSSSSDSCTTNDA